MISVAIAGLTGQGIETAGEILSSSLNKLGYTHRAWRDFSTIIRGGHTLFELYISEKKDNPPPRMEKIDVAVVWDDVGAALYRKKISDEKLLFASMKAHSVRDENREDVPTLGYNVWSLGIISGYLGLPRHIVFEEVKRRFKRAENERLFLSGYERGCKVQRKHPLIGVKADHVILSGNDALSIGAIAGGVRHYYGYPITLRKFNEMASCAWRERLSSRR